jgi:hypothetical protein
MPGSSGLSNHSRERNRRRAIPFFIILPLYGGGPEEGIRRRMLNIDKPGELRMSGRLLSQGNDYP